MESYLRWIERQTRESLFIFDFSISALRMRKALLTLSLCGLHLTAAADVINSASVVNGFGVSNSGCGQAPGSTLSSIEGDVAAAFSSSGDNCMASASVTAGGGVVTATANYTKDFGHSVNSRASASGSSTYTLLLNPPESWDGGLIPFGWTGSASGSVNMYAESPEPNRGAAATLEATIGFTAFINNFTSRTVNTSAEITALEVTDGMTPGVSDSDSLQVTLVASEIMIRPDRPISIGMSLLATASGQGIADVFSLANALSANSLTFAKEGPVFSLPEGWTADLPEANIFNNRWIDPRVVPLPAGFWLFFSGLSSIVGIAYKKKKSLLLTQV